MKDRVTTIGTENTEESEKYDEKQPVVNGIFLKIEFLDGGDSQEYKSTSNQQTCFNKTVIRAVIVVALNPQSLLEIFHSRPTYNQFTAFYIRHDKVIFAIKPWAEFTDTIKVN